MLSETQLVLMAKHYFALRQRALLEGSLMLCYCQDFMFIVIFALPYVVQTKPASSFRPVTEVYHTNNTFSFLIQLFHILTDG